MVPNNMLKGGYKQKIQTLSENNKALAEALESCRSKCSENEKNLIQVSTVALQNSISAKAKLSKLAKDLKQLQLSVEDIISFMNSNSTAYPNRFTQNLKLKMPQDCLSILVESISEEVCSNWEDFSISKPHSALGENESFTEKGSPKSPFSIFPTKKLTKSKKIKQKKIPSIQKQCKEKVLEAPSKSQSRKQAPSSDIQKPCTYKRRKNLSEIQVLQEFSHQTRKKQKSNLLSESKKINQMKEHLAINLSPEQSINNILQDPKIYVTNANQPQANLEDVSEKELHSTNNILDNRVGTVLHKISKKSCMTQIPKAGKTNRHPKKNSEENRNVTISCDDSKRTKIVLKPSKIQADKNVNQYEANIKVTNFGKKAKCDKENNESENLDLSDKIHQISKGSRKPLQNKQNLSSVENISCTVRAEIHKPPSDKLTVKKTHSSNVAYKIMQPCVILTDIRDTSLFIESDVEETPVEDQNEECRKKKTKLNLTDGKNSKKRGSIPPSHLKSSRLCRRKQICYKENRLNKKMRRS